MTTPRITITPGCYHVGLEPCVIATTLGSCVAVCLHDPIRGIGGMNHFVMPHAPNHRRDDPYFGDAAIGQLVANLEASGSRGPALTAKIFGGANALWPEALSLFAIGHQNIALARQELVRLHIPLVAERVGGQTGITIEMESWSGAIRLRPIGRSR